MYLNGNSLTRCAYGGRINKLKTLVRERQGVLMLCARTEIKDTQHLTDCIQYLFADEEGVVVKRDDSAYQPNQRKDGGWYKTKPEVC